MSAPNASSAGEALRQAILDALREMDARVSAAAPSETDVHLARRAAKRARALARLAPHGLEKLANHTRAHVGDARRMLGGARDAQVRRATLERLRPRLGDAHAALARLVEDPQANVPAGDRQAALAALRALIRDWRLCEIGDDSAAIVAAAARAYRRTRRRADRARGGATEDLHRWRSAVVDLEYHADFLARFAPYMGRQRDEADRLRKYLGDLNDLDALAAFVRQRRRDDEAAHAAHRRLREASAEERARLLEKALRLGDRLLAKPPARWAERLRRSFAQ